MRKKNERGAAMVTAMAAALIISITAAVVLNMTFRRFELSVFRSDRAIAGSEAEAGLQYAFARLDKDAAFRRAVQDKAPAEYVITSDPSTPRDVLVPELQLGKKVNTETNPDRTPGPDYDKYFGGKHVTVFITYNAGPPERYQVRARTDYGK